MRKHFVSRLRDEFFEAAAPAGHRVHPVLESWTRRELLRGGAAVVIGVGAAELLAACAAPATSSPTPSATPVPPIPEVSLFVTETTFDAPETLSAGIVRVSLENKGGVPSALAFTRLREGRSFDAVKADYPKPGPQLSNLMLVFEAFGGFDGVLPGERRRVVMDLPAGTYMLSSRAAGGPAAGIIRMLVVAPASGPTAPEPTADVTVSLTDGLAPTVPATVKATTTWKITNDGQLPHGFTVYRFKAGKSAADLMNFFAGGGGPIPAESVAGCGLLSPGKRAWLTSALAPGEYLGGCTVPGRNPPQLHLNEGETAKIIVG